MSPSSVEAIARDWARTRARTLALVSLADEAEWSTAFHPDFSPLGWHFGHIAFFESLWGLERVGLPSPIGEAEHTLFNPFLCEKSKRVALPEKQALFALADEVRSRVLHSLDERRAQSHTLYFNLVRAHEEQHQETIATILRMRPVRTGAFVADVPDDAQADVVSTVFDVPAGTFLMGEKDPAVGYDNERGAHEVTLGAFQIDAAPVTNAAWLRFLDDGGYERKEFWTEAGWAWRASAKVAWPSTWERREGTWWLRGLAGDVLLPLAHPVEGISAHEADAFAAYERAELPTEAQWERAARAFDDGRHAIGGTREGTRRCGVGADFVGNVWEWTKSIFAPYPGFAPWPYNEYSMPWFDGRHRVMRGGSWATARGIARPSFRNWYEPHWRHMFVGVRLVREQETERVW